MENGRAKFYSKKLIKKYDIDLRELVVLTEAASNGYLFNPVIPLLAGAKKVFAFCQDSKYGSAEHVFSQVEGIVKELGFESRYSSIRALNRELLSQVDIITNSGHLRPITGGIINALKPTAVIPLMWESWEWREGEIDIQEAKARGILVLGTDEVKCNMHLYNPISALSLLISQEVSFIDDCFLVIGDQELPALSTVKGFQDLGLRCRSLLTSATRPEINELLEWATYILVAEHRDRRLLLGPGGIIDTKELCQFEINAVGVICGGVDREHLISNGISVFPEKLSPPGFLSYLPTALGPYPAMDLFAAGLKVGEAMSRARRRGLTIQESTAEALLKSPAMDLIGEHAWL